MLNLRKNGWLFSGIKLIIYSIKKTSVFQYMQMLQIILYRLQHGAACRCRAERRFSSCNRNSRNFASGSGSPLQPAFRPYNASPFYERYVCIDSETDECQVVPAKVADFFRCVLFVLAEQYTRKAAVVLPISVKTYLLHVLLPRNSNAFVFTEAFFIFSKTKKRIGNSLPILLNLTFLFLTLCISFFKIRNYLCVILFINFKFLMINDKSCEDADERKYKHRYLHNPYR